MEDSCSSAVSTTPSRPTLQVSPRSLAAALLTDLDALWTGASAPERKEIAAKIFAALYVDLDQPGVVHVELQPEIHGLWEGINHDTTRVIDGARTHNRWSHNPELCQLSYDHHDGSARPVGFEPTTLDLEGPCSILMSYGRPPLGV
jgi:hypothetical protein